MNVNISVNTHVTNFISKMPGLTPDAQQAMEQAVANECNRTNWQSSFSYEIGQFFLAIINRSDKQIAKRAMLEGQMTILSQLMGVENNEIPSKIKKMLDAVNGKMLEILVIVNKRNLPASQNPLDDALLQLQISVVIIPFARKTLLFLGKECYKIGKDFVKNPTKINKLNAGEQALVQLALHFFQDLTKDLTKGIKIKASALIGRSSVIIDGFIDRFSPAPALNHPASMND